MPDAFGFTTIGSGSGTGSFSFGSRSLAGIGSTSELGYANSIGKDLMASGRFNIGEDIRWTSFTKTFDVVGWGVVPFSIASLCMGNDGPGRFEP